MDINNILDEIKANLTGDPQKDGPFLKEQADKYKNTEISQELERELSKLLFQISDRDYYEGMDNFLDEENRKVIEQLEYAEKRLNNLNYDEAIKILEEIIRNNIFAWNDTADYTYKCFGTPLEFLLYKNLFEDKENAKEIKPVNFDLAKVYWMYGHALTHKRRFDEAQNAFERAAQLNPVDPEIHIHYGELAKQTHSIELLQKTARMLLMCATTKEQVGRAYFNYSFYYTENGQYEKALALLQMSRIFRHSELHEPEREYIVKQMGLSETPKDYTSDELMNILTSENIQPGPSAAVVHLANVIAKDFEQTLDLRNARLFYGIVYELTENKDILEHLNELDNSIRNIKEFKQK